MCTQTCVCVCVNMYRFVHLNKHTHTYIYIYTFELHKYMYIYIYIYTYRHNYYYFQSGDALRSSSWRTPWPSDKLQIFFQVQFPRASTDQTALHRDNISLKDMG